MALPSRLKIRGIRSFGPEAEDTQALDFSPPLVVIVGDNGTGKTTIIECLRFALTGEVPPGSHKGLHFLHESAALSDGESTLEGEVELTITDANDCDVTVARRLQLDRQRQKQPKLLDPTIKFDVNAEICQMSGRPQDVSACMSDVMQVPKAVIDHVIFCHQEDSHWPLDEAQKVKKKFDEIFDTKPHDEALEKLLKMRREFEQRLCETKPETEKNLIHRTQARGMREKLERDGARCEEIATQCAELDEKLAVLGEKRAELREIERKFAEWRAQKLKCEEKVASFGRECKRLSLNVLRSSRQELESELKAIGEHEAATRSKNVDLSAKNEALRAEQAQREKDLVELRREQVEVFCSQRQMQAKLSERFARAKELCGQLGIDFCGKRQATHAVPDEIVSEISAQVASREAQLKADSLSSNSASQELLSGLRARRVELETLIASSRSELKSRSEQLEKSRDELGRSEKDLSTSREIVAAFGKIEADLRRRCEDNRLGRLEERKSRLKADIGELEARQVALFDDLKALHAVASSKVELDVKEADLEQKKREFAALKSSSSQVLATLFKDVNIDANFHSHIQKRQNLLRLEVEEFERKIKANEVAKIRLELKTRATAGRKSRKAHKLAEIERKIRNLCENGVEKFPEILAAQQQNVAEIHAKLAAEESSKATQQQNQARVVETACCPLCCKKFEGDEGHELFDALLCSVDEASNKMAAIEGELASATQRLDELAAAKVFFEKIPRLQSALREAEEELRECAKNTQKCAEERSDLERRCSKPRAVASLIKLSVVGDMMRLDAIGKAIEERSKEVEALRLKIAGKSSGKSFCDAICEQEDVCRELRQKREQMGEIEGKISCFQNTMVEIHKQLRTLSDKRGEHSYKVKTLDLAREQIEKASQDKSRLQVKLGQLEEELIAIEAQTVTETQGQLDSLAKLKDKIESDERSLKELHFKARTLADLTAQLKLFERMNLDEKSRKISTKISVHELNASLKAACMRDNEAAMQEGREALSRHAVERRNVQDNLQLLALQEEASSAAEKCTQLEALMAGVDVAKISEEGAKIATEIDDCRRSKHQLIGAGTSLKRSMQELRRELDKPHLKDAEANYRRSHAEQAVLTATIADLQRFCERLEMALLEHHELKMAAVNAKIERLWSSVYRGDDIETILVRTHEEKSRTTLRRRSYDYRVLQRKVGGELSEMRGRCSSGQKALAALVIRMALAETFGSQLGLLALDEPTACLDEANVRAVAAELAAIASARNDGKFMLIVITHDAEFVEAFEGGAVCYKVSMAGGVSLVRKLRG